jgi:hypothetical protein
MVTFGVARANAGHRSASRTGAGRAFAIFEAAS